MRYPLVVRRRVPGAIRVLALVTGFAISSAAQQQTPPAGARMSGTVFDSLSGQVIVDAVVQLVNADDPARFPRAMRSDSAGAFEFDGVGVGRYYISFLHPMLDVLNIEAPVYLAEVRDTSAFRFTMATPSAQTLHAKYCGQRVLHDSTGVLIGRILGGNDRLPMTGARVVAR